MDKIKIIFLIFSLSACLLFVGCDLLFGIEVDHECVYSDWYEVEPSTCSKSGREERTCIICYETVTRSIAKKDHSPVFLDKSDATCIEIGRESGSYCEECMVILSGLEEIAATGHIEVVDPAVEATNDKPGRTEGKHCEKCGEVLIKQTTIFFGSFAAPEKYHSNYAYTTLLELDNGRNIASFYNEIDDAASNFHTSLNDAKYRKNGEDDVYYLADLTFSDNGINSEEAMTALSAYVKDHPLYYWISTYILYTDSFITVRVDEEYADGEIREQINIQLYGAIEQYVMALDGESSEYGITLGLHDFIISGADYAYQSDGVTPSIDRSAHNVLGVLLEGEGVCESYAKAFQLFLNYYGIDNVYVSGYAGEPHAWNLVMLDDNRWYWYDLTWDDQPSKMLGVTHNYFCVSSSEFVDWGDGRTSVSKKFEHDHTPHNPGNMGLNYTYEIPTVSDIPYDYDGLMIRDEIIIKDELSYVLVGFNKLALISINREGEILIPETLNYRGSDLRVVCIGKYEEEKGVFVGGSIIEYVQGANLHIDVTSIYIPSTVEFIWDFAFDYCNTIKSFDVSADNPVFTSRDGVLFTKSLYTLIKYPLAKYGSSYTVPSKTVEIAFNAFGDGGNVFCPKHLRTLTIPSTVEVIGGANGGKGYRNERPASVSDIVYLDGYVDRLYKMLGSGLKIK